MRLFELKDLDILSIEECIGCYDDFNDKEKNCFGKIKKFKTFKVKLKVLPKEPKWVKCTRNEYDMWEAYHKMKKENSRLCWDFSDRLENGRTVWHIRDRTEMYIKDVFIELYDYLTPYEAKKYIKEHLEDEEHKISIGVRYEESIHNDFKNYLNRKFDEYIIWK